MASQWLCASLLGTLAWASATAAPTRIALLCESPAPAVQGLLEIAEVELSAQPDLIVLDRRQVDRLLREQAISLAGMTREEFAVRAASVLAVQVFAWIELDEHQKEPLALSAFDAETTIRLVDETLPRMPADEVPAYIVASLQTALEKRNRIDQEGVAFSLLSVRNVDLPPSESPLFQSLSRLFLRRINGSPRLSILERERLGRVAEEWRLQGDIAAQRPAASLVLAEMEVARGTASDERLIALRLISTAGQELAVYRAAWNRNMDPIQAIERLAEEVCAFLDAGTLPAVADRNAEARRFYAEGMHARAHHRIPQAALAFETAYVLRPELRRHQQRLMRSLIEHAQYLLRPKAHTMVGANPFVPADDLAMSIGLAMRALDLHALLTGDAPPARIPTRPKATYRLHYGYIYRMSSVAESNFTAEINSQRIDLQDRFRTFIRNQVHAHQAQVTNQEEFEEYTVWLSNLVTLEHASLCATADQWVADTIDQLTGWLHLAKSHRLFANQTLDVNRLLARLTARTEQFSHFYDVTGYSQWKLEDRHIHALDSLFDQMIAHPQPLIQVYGSGGRLWAHLHRMPGMDASAAFTEIREAILRALDDSATTDAPTRVMLYHAWLDATQVLPDALDHEKEHALLFDAMMRHQELAHHVARTVCAENVQPYPLWAGIHDVFKRPTVRIDPSAYSVRLKRVDAMLDAIAAGKMRLLNDSPETMTAALTILKQDLMVRGAVGESDPTSPFRGERMLVERSRDGFVHISPPAIREDGLYFLATQQGKEHLHAMLLRQDLEGGPTVRVAAFKLPAELGRLASADVLARPVFGDSFAVLHARGQGLFVLHKGEISPRKLGLEDGLPSLSVHATAAAGNGIFYVAGERDRSTYIGYYNVATDAHHLVASTERKDAKSELDSDAPYIVNFMHYDAPRNRILFLRTYSLTAPVPPRRRFGLWSFNLDTRELECVLQLWRHSRGAQVYPDGRILVFADGAGIWFDPADNTAEVLYALPSARISRELSADRARFHPARLPPGPHAWIDDCLWITQPLGRVSSRDGAFQAVPASHQSLRMDPWWWNTLALVTTPQRALIAANTGAIWYFPLGFDATHPERRMDHGW